jgi:formate hydrogenlyase transcriptional activator
MLDEQTANEFHLGTFGNALDSAAVQADLQHIICSFTARLRGGSVPFDLLYLAFHDATAKAMRISYLQAAPPIALRTGLPVALRTGLEISLEGSASGYVWSTQQKATFDSTSAKSFIKERTLLAHERIDCLCVLPLTTAQRKLGTLSLGRITDCPFSDAEVELLAPAVGEMALALDNALHHHQVAVYQKALQDAQDRCRLLRSISDTVVRNLDLSQLFTAISVALRTLIRHDYASLSLPELNHDDLRIYAVDFPEGKGLLHVDQLNPIEGSLAGRALTVKKPVMVARLRYSQFPVDSSSKWEAEGLKSACAIPLVSNSSTVGVITVGRAQEGAFNMSDVTMLQELSSSIAIAVQNALAFREISLLKDQLAEHRDYLEREIRAEFNFNEIKGESAALKEVLQAVSTVAPTDVPVLILGETGTGKELIARAIHQRSQRAQYPMVKINCAAIPAALIESELFGFEKGAFTGAMTSKKGRLELANKGTIFLDEIGELPIESQSKLLRVLQEHEFERLGGTRTLHADIRVIAATNRDLRQMMDDKQFRSDLYYRLRVFPITVPPLRERRDDVPILVRFFTEKYARRMGRKITNISETAMKALCAWHWPGNIREMENFIERAVILSRGEVLDVPVAELKEPTNTNLERTDTLEATEREYILQILKDAGGVIAGPRGAAAKLGLKRSTLQGKMRKLGISL